MIRAPLLFASLATLGTAVGSPIVGDTHNVPPGFHLSVGQVCQLIADSISSASAVYYNGSLNYQQDISHWALSSTQFAACSVEPGTVQDVSVVLKIIGRTKTDFAVKGGGHATNPGFSSTPGVQIAMSRFSEVVYDSTSQTATVGAGLIWDDVYAALDPHGVNVVGGRVSGIGVAGFTLGGGYSWLTNQYGLTIDTVQTFELVMPNGTAINVTESNPDLFFALKGGMNNFGIVTRFTLKTFPQTHVWGGYVAYNSSQIDQVNQATANFAANLRDPKAGSIATYNYVGTQGNNVIVIVFYDAPAQPAGIFDEFLAIPSVMRNISVQSFPSFLQSLPVNAYIVGAARGSRNKHIFRGVFNAISLPSIPLSFLEAVVNQINYWSKHLPADVFFLSYDVEPFVQTLFNHNTTPSAYPPDRTRPLFPLNIYFAWMSPASDQLVWDAVRESAKVLSKEIEHDIGHNIDHPFIYPNYAIFDTPLVDLYGTNVPRLQAIKEAADPQNVMGLTGGFKL